ncbi:MAG: glycosyltransferase [Mariprofundaceae bacterium]|nr:glycosyltransferase [Mariprofundaceae bacterium]
MKRDFETLFADVAWFSPDLEAEFARDWVRYRNDDNPTGVCWFVPAAVACPVLSVIIPTADADRGGYFIKLMQSLTEQDMQDFELIVIKGDKRQGRGINIAVAKAKGQYVLTVDDDSSLPDAQTFSKMIKAMDEHPDIGMAGGNNTVPDWVSPFVQRVMEQVPRRSWSPVSEIMDSDLAEHPCLMMRADLFRQVGGENEVIPRGLDPYLRQVFREADTRVVVLPDIIYHHLPPETWAGLLGQMYRNGYQAAYANIHSPEWVIETPAAHGDFVLRVPLRQRILRYPLRMLQSLWQGKWLWVICQTWYAVGFVRGWLKERT